MKLENIMEKIKNFIEKHISLFVIVFVIFIVLLVASIDLKGGEESQSSLYNKTSEEIKTTNESNQYVRIERSTPEGPDIETWDIYTPIVVYFSEPVYKESIKIRVIPNIEMVPIKIREDDNYVQLFPKEGWYPGVNYKITISEASSLSGKRLNTPYTRNMKIIKTEGPAVY